MTKLETIIQKISDKTVTIGVIGLGYVGLPLAVTFARNGVGLRYSICISCHLRELRKW
jgi:hypothetical protein